MLLGDTGAWDSGGRSRLRRVHRKSISFQRIQGEQILQLPTISNLDGLFAPFQPIFIGKPDASMGWGSKGTPHGKKNTQTSTGGLFDTFAGDIEDTAGVKVESPPNPQNRNHDHTLDRTHGKEMHKHAAHVFELIARLHAHYVFYTCANVNANAQYIGE